jgi:hypothetical protein
VEGEIMQFMGMDSQKLWNDFCFQVERLKKAPEDAFQFVAEDIFEKFGWIQSENEII